MYVGACHAIIALVIFDATVGQKVFFRSRTKWC
jgi:hypothetical protein